MDRITIGLFKFRGCRYPLDLWNFRLKKHVFFFKEFNVGWIRYWMLRAYLIWQHLHKLGLSVLFFRNTIIGEEGRADKSIWKTCPTVFFLLIWNFHGCYGNAASWIIVWCFRLLLHSCYVLHIVHDKICHSLNEETQINASRAESQIPRETGSVAHAQRWNLPAVDLY